MISIVFDELIKFKQWSDSDDDVKYEEEFKCFLLISFDQVLISILEYKQSVNLPL